MFERLLPFYEWCGNTWLGTTIRDTVWAFPVIETFHLLALAVLLGTVLIVNTRVLGLGMRYLPLSRELEPWMLASIGVGLISGVLLFLSEPMKCYESYSFPVKIGLIAAGITFHFTLQRRWAMAEEDRRSSFKAKAAASLAIVIWTGVGVAGKGIPYV